MRHTLILLALLGGCIAPVEAPEDETTWEADEDPGQPLGGWERPPEPDLCGYAAEKGGVKIPILCYWGPPRHDDVELTNPWEQQLAPQYGVEQTE